MKTQAVFFKSHIAHVRPMFESSWGAMLAAFSVILEQTDDDKQVCFSMMPETHTLKFSLSLSQKQEK